MEAAENCTKAIRATQKAELQANSIINAMYEGCVSHSVAVRYLVMPYVKYVNMLQHFVRSHVRHVCVLLPLVRPHVRHVCLGLHIAVSLKGRTTYIWFFGCGFACAIAMGYAGFRLLFGTVIVF